MCRHPGVSGQQREQVPGSGKGDVWRTLTYHRHEIDTAQFLPRNESAPAPPARQSRPQPYNQPQPCSHILSGPPGTLMNKLTLGASLTLVALLGMVSAQPVGPPERPHGIKTRTPWKTSRLTGSPDPPHPYKVERVFPKLR